MTNKLEILVPLEVLPEEGAEIQAFVGRNGSTTSADLLRYYLELTSESPLVFGVGENGVTTGDGEAPIVGLQHSRFQYEGNRDEAQPWFDLSPSQTVLDLGIDPDRENAEVVVSEEEGPEEYLRSFLEHFQERLEHSTRGFSGTAIPLLRWGRGQEDSEDGILVQFCGVVLADEELVGHLRTPSGNGAGIGFDETLGLVLEEAEVEARGVREVVASLAIMGITLAATPSADAGLFGLFKKKSSPRTTQVSRPNAYQAPARVNQAVLQSGGDSRVLVDVSAQRAYVFVGGQLAIDTPISTARDGKHTPRGTFEITQRVRTGKTSSIYGCSLPCWMRLDQSAIGMHVGDLPGYPASAGCIRLPHDIAPLVFNATERGTTVRVVDSWQSSTMVAQR